MSPATETKIWLAIKSRVESIPLPFPAAWPSEVFEPPYSGNKLLPYLRIGRVTVAPSSVLIAEGSRHLRMGTLIVTLVHPLIPTAPGGGGFNASVYDQIAGEISDHFADGTKMSYNDVCVKVTSQPHAQPGYQEDGFWTVPVSIPWRTFA